MNDIPTKIASRLVANHGLDAAKQAVPEVVIDAQHAGNNYWLSIWRDVQRGLGNWSGGED